jgi:hypothetical protein
MKIAELTGWTDVGYESVHDDGEWVMIYTGTSPAGEYARVPRWPYSRDDAFGLCLDVATPRGWAIGITPYVPMFFVVTFTHGRTDSLMFHEKADTPAEALARLAYAALQGVQDE